MRPDFEFSDKNVNIYTPHVVSTSTLPTYNRTRRCVFVMHFKYVIVNTISACRK